MNRTTILLTLLLFFVVQGAAIAAPTVPTGTLTVDRIDNNAGLPCTAAANDCTLRSAIDLVNASADSSHTILLDIAFWSPNADSGAGPVIPLLPITQNNVTIKPSANQTIVQINAQKRLDEIFVIEGDNVTIEGLQISRVTAVPAAALVRIMGSADNTIIRNNEIGTGPDCASRDGRTGIDIKSGASNVYIYNNELNCLDAYGIYISNATNVFIGKDENGIRDGNTLTNVPWGITVEANDVEIYANTITSSSGYGINIDGDRNEIVANNIIGMSENGIHLYDGTGTVIQGNVIASSGQTGLRVSSGAQGTQIGCNPFASTITDAHRNYIYGNQGDGIDIRGADNTFILCNLIGFTPGYVVAGNSGSGIRIGSGSLQTNVGTVAGVYNLIGNNGEAGILLDESSGVIVRGNRIGISFGGTVARPNGANGITLNNADNNTIGGESADHRNVVSGNMGSGIALSNGSTGNTIQANFVGTTLNGSAALGNSSYGISLQASDNNLIGSETAAAGRNVVSGNKESGIDLNNADSNDVWGNYIGIGGDGSADIGNEGSGITILNGSANNDIGNVSETSRNVINHNDENGITLHLAGVENRIRIFYVILLLVLTVGVSKT